MAYVSELQRLWAKERTQFKFACKFGTGSKTDPQPKQKADPLGRLVLAGDLGFEPRHTESESAVLPLHKSPMRHLLYHTKK